MPNYLAEYRVRIRNRADSADLLIVTSARGDTAPNYPYLKDAPSGDGASFNPVTGEALLGSYTVRVVDPIVSGSSRLFTQHIEDAGGRIQLSYLKVFNERRLDGGAYGVMHAGYLTGFRLISDTVWELTVQDPTRVQNSFELFNALDSMTITDFLALWPNRGCIVGGPVKGSFLNMQDLGGWTMRVQQVLGSGSGIRWLQPLRTYGPGSWNPDYTSRDAYNRFCGIINEKVRALRSPSLEGFSTGPLALSTIADAYAPYMIWPGVITLIDGVPFRPVTPSIAQQTYGEGDELLDLVSPHRTAPGLFVFQDGKTLTVGTTVRVRCLTVLPSPESPIYVDRHPADLFSDMQTIAGVPVNAAAVTALKEALGTSLRHSERITGTRRLGEFLADAVYRPHRVAVRVNSSAELVPFSTRIFANTVPSVTITDAMVKTGSVRAFEFDVSDALSRVTLIFKRQQAMVGDALDSIVETEVELTWKNQESGALQTGTFEASIPGMLRVTSSTADPIGIGWLRGLAQQLFDRFGRGVQGAEMLVIRGNGSSDADTLVLGQEVLVDVAQLPNHNKRLGDDPAITARAMQIVQITENIATRRVMLVDSGPNANAISTKPTHTIAANAAAPRTIAQVTITNAAALNALGYAVRVQMAVGSSPAATDYVDFYTSEPGAVPTTSIVTPSVVAGSTVFVRARSEKADARPSDWSTPVSVSLTVLNAPTSLSASAVGGDGSLADVSWTPGANAGSARTDIFVRAQGAAFSTAIRHKSLLPGSNRFRVDELTPNTAYTISVQHRDPVSQDVSVVVDVNVTTNATTRTLSPPVSPDGFSFPANVPAHQLGQTILDLSDRYGLAVVAVEVTAGVEIAEALETGVGAGTYNSYETVGLVPAIGGDWTLWYDQSPSDGLRRKLKARHVKKGCADSAYTSEVIVAPGTTDPIAIYPTSPLITRAAIQSQNATQVVVRVPVADTAPDPISASVSIAYAATGTGSVSPGSPQTIAAGSVTSDLATTGFVDFTVQKAAHGSGTGRFVVTCSRLGRVPAVDAVDIPAVDSPMPTLEVIPSTPNETHCLFTINSTSPISGGAAPTVKVKGIGCSIDIHSDGGNGAVAGIWGPGVEKTLVGVVGAIVEGIRPDTESAQATFRTTSEISGAGKIEISRTVAPKPNTVQPQGTVSIGADGAVKFSVDGPAMAASYKWQASTSSYPADATVIASGATINGRTQNDVSAGITLSLGQRVYITLVPYTAASAGGLSGQSIHLTATRHDASATKTVYFSASAMTLSDQDDSGVVYLVGASGDVRMAGTYPGFQVGVFGWCDLQVPQGCTLTNVSVDAYEDATVSAQVDVTVQEISSTGTVTDLGNDGTTDIGNETLSISLSDSTSTTRYRLEFLFLALHANDVGQGRVFGWRCTYDMPTTEASL